MSASGTLWHMSALASPMTIHGARRRPPKARADKSAKCDTKLATRRAPPTRRLNRGHGDAMAPTRIQFGERPHEAVAVSAKRTAARGGRALTAVAAPKGSMSSSLSLLLTPFPTKQQKRHAGDPAQEGRGGIPKAARAPEAQLAGLCRWHIGERTTPSRGCLRQATIARSSTPEPPGDGPWSYAYPTPSHVQRTAACKCRRRRPTRPPACH